MSLVWELEYEVSWRPRQVVYIRAETDVSALTNPNKKQAVCYPANAGGGDKGRKRGGGRAAEQEWGGSVPAVEPSPRSLARLQSRETPVRIRGCRRRQVCCRLKASDPGWRWTWGGSSPTARCCRAQMLHSVAELRPRTFHVFIYCPPNCFISPHVDQPCPSINTGLLTLDRHHAGLGPGRVLGGLDFNWNLSGELKPFISPPGGQMWKPDKRKTPWIQSQNLLTCAFS